MALRLSNKKLNLLSRITWYDIMNQLLTLNGFLELLHRKTTDQALEDYFTRITNASSRISAMVLFTKEYEQIGVSAPVWQDVRTFVETAAKKTHLGSIVLKKYLPSGAEVFAAHLLQWSFIT